MSEKPLQRRQRDVSLCGGDGKRMPQDTMMTANSAYYLNAINQCLDLTVSPISGMRIESTILVNDLHYLSRHSSRCTRFHSADAECPLFSQWPPNPAECEIETAGTTD